MIYRSNLSAPDLTPDFRHTVSRIMAHSCGHEVLSDWADKGATHPVFAGFRQCGFQTHDEVAILYNVAKQFSGGTWVDIGAHSGWTSSHIAMANCDVWAVEPMLNDPEFRQRFDENVQRVKEDVYPKRIYTFNGRSDQFFAMDAYRSEFDGVMIDGDHGSPNPLLDADRAMIRLKDRGVIMFHDAIGKPVHEGITHLMNLGFHCRIYWTPHVVALCWRGDFKPPVHHPDPRVEPAVRPWMAGFPFERCE